MLLHVGPLRREDAVHHGVAHAPVASPVVMADHAVALPPDRLDGALRAEVEVVRAQPDDPAPDGLERVTEEEQLARRIEMAALKPRRVEGVADLDTVHGGHAVVVARGPDDFSTRQIAHDPWQHVPRALPLERGGDVGGRLVLRGYRGIPQLPELAGRGGVGDVPLVGSSERLEADAVSLECGGFECDHSAKLSRPGSVVIAFPANDGRRILNGDSREKGRIASLLNGRAPDFTGSTGRIRTAPCGRRDLSAAPSLPSKIRVPSL